MLNNAGTNTIQRLVLVVVTILALQKSLIWYGKGQVVHPSMITNAQNAGMSLITINIEKRYNMSIKVTINNYRFPIHFSYKGWSVKLEKRIALFKDVGVEATFTPPTISYQFWQTLLPNEVRQKLINIGFYIEADYNKFVLCTNSYVALFKYPQETSCKFSANGGLLDRFLGQNISATEKVVKKVTEWMDVNLPKLQEEPNELSYTMYLKRNGVSENIISVIKEAYNRANFIAIRNMLSNL